MHVGLQVQGCQKALDHILGALPFGVRRSNLERFCTQETRMVADTRLDAYSKD